MDNTNIEPIDIKSKEPTNKLILKLEKYGILMVPNNFVVGLISNQSTSQIKAFTEDFFISGSQSYQSTLELALKDLSRRILKDTIKSKTRDIPIELRELLSLFQEHDRTLFRIVQDINKNP